MDDMLKVWEIYRTKGGIGTNCKKLLLVLGRETDVETYALARYGTIIDGELTTEMASGETVFWKEARYVELDDATMMTLRDDVQKIHRLEKELEALKKKVGF